MINSEKVVVIGLGEVGLPLFEILSTYYKTWGIDPRYKETEVPQKAGVLHICIPGDLPDFIDIVKEYKEKLDIKLIINHSTVVPGTTRKIANVCGVPTAFSPVRGKHTQMKQDMLSYVKFVGGIDAESANLASSHLTHVFPKVLIVKDCETTEMMKILETSYFGALICIAQEFKRYCDLLKIDYYKIFKFFKEIDYLPKKIFEPNAALGHCIPTNYGLLEKLYNGYLTEFYRESNNEKIRELNLNIKKEMDTKTRTIYKPRNL